MLILRPSRAQALVLAAGLGFVVAKDAGAVRRYVAQDATGAGNGTSWADAFLHPQDALDVAGRGDAIWVKEARYVRKRNAPQVLSLRNGVSVYGGFAGDETVLDQRDPALHETILDGEHVVEHVVVTPGGGRLDGFTITGGGLPVVGNAEGGGFSGNGATLARLVFRDNRAEFGGAAAGEDLVVEDSRFEDNFAQASGGALGVGGSSFVRRSVFLRNVAEDASGNGFGGGLSSNWGTAEIEDSAFDSNVAPVGGAVMVEGAPASAILRVRRCSFTGNEGVLGGAIAVGFYVTEALVEDSTFSQNAVESRIYTVCDPTCHNVVVSGSGGGVVAYSGDVTVRGSTFSANTADAYGGGLLVQLASAVIEDSRFLDNAAGYGGGILFDRAPFFVSDVTFARNRAIYTGGGAALDTSTEASPQTTDGTFERCRFEENLAGASGGGLVLVDGRIVIESARFLANESGGGGGGLAFTENTPSVEPRLELRNSVFAGNYAAIGGGGFHHRGAAAQIENDTFYGNTTAGQGGGLWLRLAADVTVRNTILWDNVASVSPEIAQDPGVFLSVDYSDVEGGWPGTGNLDVDPGLRDPFLHDFHLTWPGSKLLVDAGTPGFSPVYDFDGELRPIDGNLDGEARVDIGADELADPCAGQLDRDLDGRCDVVDNCPFAPNPGQQDTGGIGPGSPPDGIGDACQCGDVNGDGRVTLADSVAVTRSLLVPPTASLARPELCDVGGSAGCSLTDAVIIRRALLAPPTATVQPACDPGQP